MRYPVMESRLTRNTLGRLSPLPACVLLLLAAAFALASGCGRLSAGEGSAEGQESGVAAPVDAEPVTFVRAPVALGATALAPDMALVSFDDEGRVRARTSKGTSSILSAGKPPELEWTLTTEEAAQLGGGSGVWRASRDRAWRFEDKKVTTYRRADANSRWRVYEAATDSAWVPLAVEEQGIVVVAGPEVRVAWFDGKVVATRAFRWPAGKHKPLAAGFLQGVNVVWVYGASHFYLVNVSTGKWQLAEFPALATAWGDVRSMAFRADPKAPLRLDKPAAFAVLGTKGVHVTGAK